MTGRLLQITARQLAAALGDGWSVEWTGTHSDALSGGWRTTLHGPDRIELVLICGRTDSGRWRLFGTMTTVEEASIAGTLTSSDLTTRPPDLRMGAAISVEQMAELVERDYLPGWRALVTAVRAEIERRDASRARVHAVGEQIIAAFGGRAVWQNPDGSRAAPGEDPDRREVRFAVVDRFHAVATIRDNDNDNGTHTDTGPEVSAVELVVTGPPEHLITIIERIAALPPPT